MTLALSRFFAEDVQMERPHPTHTLGGTSVYVRGKPTNYSIGWEQQTSFGSIRPVLNELDIANLYAVWPGFNAACVRSEALKFECISAKGYRSKIWTDNLRADALILEPGQAGAIASGDCPTVVLQNTKSGQAALIHGAREALLPYRLRPHKKDVIHEKKDVITVVMESTGWHPNDVWVGIYAGIGAKHFLHPRDDAKFGKRNAQILEYFARRVGSQRGECIDLIQIIKLQCMFQGISPKNIYHDGIDTYADPDFWSHRRFRERGEPVDGRNLVLVVNHAA